MTNVIGHKNSSKTKNLTRACNSIMFDKNQNLPMLSRKNLSVFGQIKYNKDSGCFDRFYAETSNRLFPFLTEI